MKSAIASMFLLLVAFTPLKAEEAGSIQFQLEKIKREAIELTAEVKYLEKSLEGPESIRVSVYLELDHAGYTPASVEVKVSRDITLFHEYSDLEVRALKLTGIHKVGDFEIGQGESRIEVDVRGRNENQLFEKVEYDGFFNKQNRQLKLLFTVAGEDSRQRAAMSMKAW